MPSASHRLFPVLLAVVVTAFLGIPPGARAQTLVASVPEAAGTAIAVNPATNRIYVAADPAVVKVVDGDTHALVATIPVQRGPAHIAVNRATNRIFVANTRDQSLSVIDGATHAVTHLPIGGAGPIAIDEASNRAFVIRLGNNGEVTVVDGATLSWYAIDTGSYVPNAQAYDPATQRLYVSHPTSGDVRAIDMRSTSDHPPNVSIQVAGHPTALALDAASGRLYALSDDSRGPIVAIDTSTNAATPITAPGHAAGPVDVVVNPSTRRAFAGFRNEVVAVDGATRTLAFASVGTVKALAVNPGSNRVYVLEQEGSLAVLDGATLALARVGLGFAPMAIAMNPGTGRVYVTGAGFAVLQDATFTVPPPPPPPPPGVQAPAVNLQGLWWAQGGTESGWGLHVTHQGETLFATWFTYDATGRDQWLVMSEGRRTADNLYEGTLYRTTGPAFHGAFDPARVTRTPVGSATFTVLDETSARFSAVVDGRTVTKSITRQAFAQPMPACMMGGAHGAMPNYQDLWWRAPAGSESGWGMNIAHQGDMLFVTIFTYDGDGNGLWLVGSNVARTGSGSYSGTLYRTTGPALDRSPWDPGQVTRTPVGTVSVAFQDATTGTLTYSVGAATVTKPITRQVFGTPTTVCR